MNNNHTHGKRRRSPEGGASLPISKRTNTSGAFRIGSRSTDKSFDTCLSDETVLDIFSYLTFEELCTAQLVSSSWARLASDNQLWKRLFLQDHPAQRLRGARGFSEQYSILDGQHFTERREVKPLPARVRVEGQIMWKPWKWMYRVSRNWRRGRCDVGAHSTQYSISPATGSSGLSDTPTPTHADIKQPPHLLLMGDLTITASDSRSLSPTIDICSVRRSPFRFGSTRHPKSHLHSITCLALDHSPAHVLKPKQPYPDTNFRLVVFFSDGSISLFSVPPQDPSLTVESGHFSAGALRSNTSSSSVNLAVYHHPLLVAMTSSFDLILFNMPPYLETGAPVLNRTFRSFTMFPPSSLTLSTAAEKTFKLLIAFCSPVYPSHFLPAVSELCINKDLDIVSSRKSTSLGTANAWMSVEEREEKEREWRHKIASVSACGTDGKFLVVTGDHALQVYRISYRPHIRVNHAQSLPRPSKGVCALKVADGRCVCIDNSGCLSVWDLEERWGVQVAGNTFEGGDVSMGSTSVAFNERRVVSYNKETGTQIWNFDV